MRAIYKRELVYLFHTLPTYLYLCINLLLCGLFVVAFNLLQPSPSFEYSVSYFGLPLLVMVPVLCMSSLARERKNGLKDLLWSLPVGTPSLILGKFFALVTIEAILTLVLCLLPILLGSFGAVLYLPAYLSLFFYFLLSAALTALCMFLSSLTDSALVACFSGIAAELVFYLLGRIASVFPASPYASFACLAVLVLLAGVLVFVLSRNGIMTGVFLLITFTPFWILLFVRTSLYEGLVSRVLTRLSLFGLASKLTYGIFDWTALLVHLSVIAVFLLFSILKIERSRNA